MNLSLLRDERKRRGWSQADVAKALGTATKTVTRWELGRSVPFPYYREKLSALFGKTVEELGLVDEADENDAFKQVAPLVVQFDMSDVSMQRSFLADPAIPAHFKSGNTLRRYDSLLTLVKESLFATDTVFLTALDGLGGTDQTALVLKLATDQQIQAHFCRGILWAKLGFHANILGILAGWGKLLGISPSQVEDINSREAWRRALQAAIGARRMLLIIDHACRIEDAQALRVGGAACAHLLTTHLSEVAHAFAQQGAIVISQLKESDKIALLQSVRPQPGERGDSEFAIPQPATLL